MRKPTQEELKQILAEHQTWVKTGGAQGTRADLQGADLQGAYLQGANLRDANLREANLREANLRKANLQGTDLEGTDLQEADLQEANLYGTCLLKVNLHRANLKGANLKEVVLHGANFQEANLQGANLQLAEPLRANLQGASLQEANLHGANLQWANLQGANLQGADLQRANLQWTNLQGANLDEANLTDTNIEEAIDVPEKYRRSSGPDYAKMQRVAQSEVNQLRTELSKLEKSDKERREELERRIEESEKLKAEAKKRGDLAEAIEKIQLATKSDEDLIERYKKQSLGFMFGGILAYAGAIVAAIFFSSDPLSYINSFWDLKLQFNPIPLGVLLSLVGTACLRHDWKIRQLSAQLLKQHNKVVLASGILNASLDLEFLANKEGKVDESFDLVRRALLFPDSAAEPPSPQEDKQNTLLQIILEILKNNK